MGQSLSLDDIAVYVDDLREKGVDLSTVHIIVQRHAFHHTLDAEDIEYREEAPSKGTPPYRELFLGAIGGS